MARPSKHYGELSRRRTDALPERRKSMIVAVVAVKVEVAEQVADRRAIDRHVRICVRRDRIFQVVAAAIGNFRQVPVALDELYDRGVVGILM